MSVRHRALAMIGTLLCALLYANVAEAKQFHFAGPHPIAAKLGGGYCYIDAPHVHIYAPDHPALYQRVGEDEVFAADPTPFGYDGDKHPYYGHHPLNSINGQPIFCYIDGPHFHATPPPSTDDYKIKKGVAFYVGPFAPSYSVQKPKLVKQINAEYRPYATFRPTIEVEPPPEWHGEVYVAAPSVAVAAPGVTVAAPGVAVNAPSVAVSAPSVAVNAPSFAVSAPSVAVSAPGVVVAAPGVYVNSPGVRVRGPRAPAVFVAEPGGVVVEKRGHHDHGKHKGWYK